MHFFEIIVPSIGSAAVPADVLADVDARIAISIFEKVVLVGVNSDKALFTAFNADKRTGVCRGRCSIHIFDFDIAGIWAKLRWCESRLP